MWAGGGGGKRQLCMGESTQAGVACRARPTSSAAGMLHCRARSSSWLQPRHGAAQAGAVTLQLLQQCKAAEQLRQRGRVPTCRLQGRPRLVQCLPQLSGECSQGPRPRQHHARQPWHRLIHCRRGVGKGRVGQGSRVSLQWQDSLQQPPTAACCHHSRTASRASQPASRPAAGQPATHLRHQC